MNVLDFGIEVIALSTSGVLAPGPLFFANLAYGTRHDKWSGIKVAYGHTAVELPLIILLAVGLITFDAAKKYASVVGLIGGIAILAFAGLQIASIIKEKRAHDNRPNIAGSKGPFIVGIAFSALNPFFILWWFTVGLKLIADSAAFGVTAGVAILFALHIWMDYAWLASTAYLASKGTFVIKSKYYPTLLLGLTVVLIYYGVSFVLQAASQNIYP
ncbi:MAG: LysE family translocator [Thermoproteota archaeon]|nr:LysE family translocator [Thermoproteota archaeon]